jgi:DNA uptake protein ComE-like DNA-binding protein
MRTTIERALRMTAVAVAVTACAKSDAPKADTTSTTSSATTTTVTTTTPDSAAMATGAPATPATPAASGAMLDPNSATREQLLAVPGMTPTAADALIQGRPYADMTAADKAFAAAGLDASARKQVYALVWKPIDPNKATDAEILLIPGVGSRMNREFHEYRPWTSGAQFDREIGKYVDKTELARLRKYVALQ